jgi:drug/metabolite transporter (DMT)-like permease
MPISVTQQRSNCIDVLKVEIKKDLVVLNIPFGNDVRVSSPQSRIPPLVREWFPIIGPGLIWGASYLFIAEGLTAIRPEGITFVRTVIGFLVLTTLPAARRPIQRSDRKLVGVLGVIWLAFPMSMFPFAEQRVSSALTGMLNASGPLFTAIVAAGIARRWPTRPVLIALGIGLGGGMLIAAPSLGEGRSSLVGVGLILIALISYGFAINLSRPLQQRNGALPVIWRAVGVAAIVTAPTGIPAVIDAHWNRSAVLSLLALGAFGTGLANALVATAAGSGGAIRASAMSFIIPAVSLFLGVVVRNESVHGISIIGALICTAGAFLLARRGTASSSVKP